MGHIVLESASVSKRCCMAWRWEFDIFFVLNIC